MKYAVPRENRQYAAWPAVESLCGLVAGNVKTLRSSNLSVLDKPFLEFRSQCIRDAFAAAGVYAGRMRLPSPAPPRGAIIATGHQPEFHHAGVWIKNHLAARLARAVGGASLDLVVDNDVPKHLCLMMPVGGPGNARRVAVAYAQPRPDVPYEEYPPQIADSDALKSEVERAASGMPYADEAGDLVARIGNADGSGNSIADVVTAVRVSYERECGLANAEVPMSRLACTPAFGVFVQSLCREAPRFLEAHNAALAEYRRDNHIRYRVNPVPDLATRGSLVEVPFWVWLPGGRRSRLFVEVKGPTVHLYAGGAKVASVSGETSSEAAASWSVLSASKVKVRPRALSTTIFARLFLSDLFIHGIGGAKYDEGTDRIIRTFYGIEPPAYAVISATLTVDWPFAPADRREVTRLARFLRDIKYNPDRLLDPCPSDCAALVARKRSLVARAAPDADGRRQKWQSIRDTNDALAARLEPVRVHNQRELQELQKSIAADDILFGREYSCFLVGAARTVSFYDEVLAPLVRSCPEG